MRTIYYKSVKQQRIKQINKIRKGCWIHYDNADKQDVEEAAKLAHLEYIDIAESLDTYELPRLEKENGTLIIYVRIPTEKTGELLQHTKLITIILSQDYIITISKAHSSFVQKLKEDPQITTTQPTKFLIKFLTKTTNLYTKSIRKIRDNIVKKTSKISRITNKIIIELLQYEEILQEYLLALTPTRNIIRAIRLANYITIFEEDRELLEDLQINTQQSLDICSVNIKNLLAMRDSYQIIFTNELNRIIKFLTGFTIILTIPNIVSGIYGMNVQLPLQANHFAFIILLGLIIVSMIALFHVFREKNWL